MSFGAPTFFFLLLFRRVPAFLPGFLTAIVVVVFRISMDVIIKENMDWLAAFHTHYPSFSLFYLFVSLSFSKNQTFYHQPLMIGFIGCMIEILSNCVELMIQYFVLKTSITSRQ